MRKSLLQLSAGILVGIIIGIIIGFTINAYAGTSASVWYRCITTIIIPIYFAVQCMSNNEPKD